MATKKPTGLSITRSGMKFTLAWKIGDKDYGDGQQFGFAVNGGSLAHQAISKTATSKSVTLSASDFFPFKDTKLLSVAMAVNGNRKAYKDKKNKTVDPAWSGWVQKVLYLRAPAKPTASAAFTAPNKTDFSWSVATSDSDDKPFTRVEYGSVLRSEDLVTDGSKITTGWSSSTGGASGSASFTETSSVLAAGSRTRWFRVRSVGPAGVSAWTYSKHVYAMPFAASSLSSKVSVINNTMDTKLYWNASYNAAHPIDSQEAQYVIATPAAGLTCPAGASWTAGQTINGAAATNGAHFVISDTLDYDEVLFARIATKHDSNTQYSAVHVVRKSNLKEPTNVSVSQNASTYRATITATNASDVPDSKLAVIYRPSSAPSKEIVVGIIPHDQTSVTVQCPNWSRETAVAFGVYAYQGSETAITRADGVTQYTIRPNMTSAQVWHGGSVAAAPTNVRASQSDNAGEVVLTWDWTWSDADVSEISWSRNINAWESTDEPSKYQIDNLHAAQWRVSGLETGNTWYFRVRLGQTGDNVVTWGAYSEIVECDLSSAPATPSIYLSESVITEDGSVTATWAYTTTDGTAQAYAEICEANITSGGITYGEPIASVRAAQNITLNAQDYGWHAGESHNLCVRVVSASGKPSEGWSAPATVYVANPLSCSIRSTSLETITITEDGTSRQVLSLTEMPLEVEITGGDTSALTTLAIERAEDYIMARPDNTDHVGYEGETICLISVINGTSFSVSDNDLIGVFDDGAKYRIVVTIQDTLGQSASATQEFEVHWSHQAIAPEAEVVIDDDNLVAYITPTQPSGAVTGDVCDIYRLSADRPELVVEGAEWGVMYVDPYPAIGETGGYRCVFRSVNGDYITDDNHIAWTDYTAEDGYVLNYLNTIIDFGGDRAVLQYNIEVQNSWKKDFQETKYLGGSVKGDWNAAVSRTSRVNVLGYTVTDLEDIEAMRRLAVYPGICHVRTPDGSSYSADVQVSESRSHSTGGRICTFDLSITRVDPEELDGLTYDQWHTEVEP